MKFLQVIPHYVPAYNFGGPLRVAHSIGKALIKQGHDVTVCTTNLASEDSFLDVPLDEPINVDGITVYYQKVESLRSWGFAPNLKRRIEKEIINTDFLFNHFHYQYASVVGGAIARKHKTPFIVFPHGSLNQYGIRRRKFFIKHAYIKLFESKNFEDAKFLAFNCNEEVFLSLFGDKGHVVYNGISLDQFDPIPKEGAFRNSYPELRKKLIYLFLGRLNYEQKGLNVLIPAFKKLVEKNKSAHLVLAGPSEQGGLKSINSAIRDMNLNHSTTITGLLDNKKKIEALKDADVFVLSSPSEGMSISLLEAMYMNLPVVTTNRVGLNQTIKENNAGLIVNLNVNELASALITISDYNLRKSMIGCGREIIIKNHIWDNIVLMLVKDLMRI